MPNRIIKESILTSESFNALTPKTQSFFIRLIVRVDDFGRFEARPAVLRAALYPLCLDKFSEATILEMMRELCDVAMVQTYQAEGKPYLQMVNWNKYQQLRAKKSKYPPMPTFDSKCNQMISDGIECNHIRSESETETDSESRSLGDSEKTGTTKRAKYPADQEFLDGLKANPAYQHINLDIEMGKMAAWLQTPRGRGKHLTRKFIINWLNRIDAPVANTTSQENYVVRVDPC